jgi:hypothetical protein
MSLTNLSTIGFIFLAAAAGGILLLRDWRWMLAALAGLYIGVFLFVAIYWPVSMAVIKLVVGWMAAAALGITQLNQKETSEEHSWPSGIIFRLLAMGLVVLVTMSIASKVVVWLPGNIYLPVAEGSMVLMGLGLLHLGMTAQPLRVIVGLLTVLAGFEILFAAVENSILVAGLLASVNLGLALVGIYILNSSGETRE